MEPADKSVILRCRVQHALVTASLDEDNGDFVFVVCRRGLEHAMGTRFTTGEQRRIKVTLEDLEPHRS